MDCNSAVIAGLSVSDFRDFVGVKFTNVFKMSREICDKYNECHETKLNHLQLKIAKEEGKVKVIWDDKNFEDKENLSETIQKTIATHAIKFKNKVVHRHLNIRVPASHSEIGSLLKEQGKYHKEFIVSVKEKLELSSLNVKIMPYNNDSYSMYRMIGFNNLCEDVSYNQKTDTVNIDRYGESILFICQFSGPKNLEINKFDSELIKFIAKNSDIFEINSESDDDGECGEAD